MANHKELASQWFEALRDQVCSAYEKIESEYAKINNLTPAKFKKKNWQREGGGGGQISLMKGHVFEKVGVNISAVYGKFTENFGKQIPGTEKDQSFFATGISSVAHMCSPLVPAMHFNTRYIETSKSWFGGGGDLTPIIIDENETAKFHSALKEACDLHDTKYYPEFKKACDEYFYLKHRNEKRGVGGIFYDYLNSGSFEDDFTFTKSVGKAIYSTYLEIVRAKMLLPWSAEQRELQLIKRGRYVEFNLLYDRGTSFGLATGGNIEAIFMSMPPEVKWE